MTEKEVCIDEKNPRFKELLKLLNLEFGRIIDQIPGVESTSNPKLSNHKLVVTPNLFSDYGQFDVEKHHPELIEILHNLLMIKELPINIFFSLDLSAYGIKVHNMYDNFFESVFPYYLFWNSYLSSKVLSMINGWRRCLFNKRMPIRIIVPLMGFYLPEGHEKNIKQFSYNIKLIEDEDSQINLKSLHNYSILLTQKKAESEDLEFAFQGINNQFSKYCINAKGRIPCNFEKLPTENSMSYLWDKIKHIAQAICLEGTNPRFGTPFYKFPWWISNHFKHNLKFNYPDWMSARYMFRGYYHGLVPDTETHIMDQIRQRVKYLSKGRKYYEASFISGSSYAFDPNTEIIMESAKDRVKISNPIKIKDSFQKLNNKNSTLNFYRSSFILDRVLRLSQRELIEDVILDTCVILEAIFLYRISKELSYRLKLNLSSLIAEDLETFKELFEFYSQLYKFRSSIIHGSPITEKSKAKKKTPYEQFVKKCYPKSFEYFDQQDTLKMLRFKKFIQYDLFLRISHILNIILKDNIDYRNKFQKIGFLNIFSKKKIVSNVI